MRSASAAFSNPVQHGATLQIDRCTFHGEASREWNALPKWDAAVSDLTQLDLTGPYEVLVRLPEAEALFLWESMDPALSGQPRSLEPLRQFQSVERDCRHAVV
jgi:hypothetical protein